MINLREDGHPRVFDDLDQASHGLGLAGREGVGGLADHIVPEHRGPGRHALGRGVGTDQHAEERQTINALETGKYDPSLPLAFKIARLFGQSIETIFDDGEA